MAWEARVPAPLMPLGIFRHRNLSTANASGITNTSFMIGGAIGLAVLASAASARTHHLAASGHSNLAALTGGYHLAFVIGAIFAIAGAAIGSIFLRTRSVATEAPHAEAVLEAA